MTSLSESKLESRNQLAVTELTDAAWNGKVAVVKSMLSTCSGDIINSPNTRGQTALFCACRQGHTDIVFLLLQFPGIELNVQVNPHGGTPLHAASFGGYTEILAALLWKGANPNIANSIGLKPIQEAKDSTFEIYTFHQTANLPATLAKFPRIKELGVSVSNIVKSTAYTTPEVVISIDTVDGIKTKSVPPSRKVIQVMTDLCQDNAWKQSEYVTRDVNGKVVGKDTTVGELEGLKLTFTPSDAVLLGFLTSACTNGSQDTFNYLIQNARVKFIANAFNERGQCPLLCACSGGHIEVVLEMINRVPNLDLNIQDPQHGGTPLHAASLASHADVVALLLAAGADVNLKNKAGFTPHQEAKGAVSEVYSTFRTKGNFSLQKKYPILKKLNLPTVPLSTTSSPITPIKITRKKSRAVLKAKKQISTLTKFRSSMSILLSSDQMWTYYLYFAPKVDVMDLSPIEIAQQLSLMDLKYMKQVKPHELAKAGFGKEGKQILAPNVLNHADYFNHIGAWLSTVILSVPIKEERIKHLSFMVEVLQYVHKYNNLDTAFSIQSAFESSAVYRLRQTFAGISEYLINSINSVTQLCKPENNFAGIRKQLKEGVQPALPYFGMYLKDLTFINDGNKGVRREELVNQVLDEISFYQQSDYKFRAHKKIQKLLRRSWTMTEAQRNDVSSLLEPKMPKPSGDPAEEAAEKQKESEIQSTSAKQASVLLQSLKEIEKAHYINAFQQIDVEQFIDLLKEVPHDCFIVCKDTKIGLHKLILEARCPILLSVVSSGSSRSQQTLRRDAAFQTKRVTATSRRETTLAQAQQLTKSQIQKVKSLLLSLTSFTVSKLVSFIYDDVVSWHDDNVFELYDLWEIAQMCNLFRLEAMITAYAITSQTSKNVIDFGVAAIECANRRAWITTVTVINECLDSPKVTTHPKYQLVMQEKEHWEGIITNPKIKEVLPRVPPSTWFNDISPILWKKKAGDLRLKILDSYGKEGSIIVHVPIINHHSTILKQTMIPSASSGSLEASSLDASEIAVLDSFSDAEVPILLLKKIFNFIYTQRFETLDVVDTVFLLAIIEHYGVYDATQIAYYLKASLKPLLTNIGNQSKLSKAIQKITDNHACQFLLGKLDEICADCPWKEFILQPLRRRAKALKFQFKIHKALQEENAKLKERISELEGENSKLVQKVMEYEKKDK